MTLYKLVDGYTIQANCKEDFVIKLRNSSFFPTDSVESYIAEFAKRVYIIYGINVRSDNLSDFVDDLIFYNIVYISLPN